MVAHRIIWSLVFLLGILTITRGWSSVRQVFRTPRTFGLLVLAAVAITINWTTYVYSVEAGLVVEASLGYFINPLVTVALGVIVLHEKLRVPQWTAVAIAAVGVLVIAVSEGAAPWIGLILAFSFGTYGLLKKLAGVGAVPSLTVETMVLAPIAVFVLANAEIHGEAAFAIGGWSITALLILLGPVTAVPLLAYAGAAIRLPLAILGVMQYITPLCIFVLGITVFGNQVSSGEWVGFIIIWVSLAVFSFDTIRHSRRPSPADEMEVVELA